MAQMRLSSTDSSIADAASPLDLISASLTIALREDRGLRKKRKPKVTEFRLQKQTDLFSAPYTVQLHKYDYDTL